MNINDCARLLWAWPTLKCFRRPCRYLMSDHVLRVPPLLASKLSRPFTALLHHGYTTECLHDSIIQSIPKDLKDTAIPNNYCGIVLASCLSKLLELCIWMSFPKFFCTSDLQFGSKKGFSTDLRITALDYWNLFHLRSKVRCPLLGMSKAFDMIDHGQLFLRLCISRICLTLLSNFCCSGTTISIWRLGEMVFYLHPFLWLMGSSREESYLQYCLLFT